VVRFGELTQKSVTEYAFAVVLRDEFESTCFSFQLSIATLFQVELEKADPLRLPM